MSIYTILIILGLLLIIIFLIAKIVVINLSLKEIQKELSAFLDNDTNAKITVSTNNKQVLALANTLNEYLTSYHSTELEYKKGNKHLHETITNITHDIRTPLTVIKGYIGLLEKNSVHIQKDYINIINDKLASIVNMTENLLDYSKCLDKIDYVNKESMCLNEVLEQVVVSFYALFKEKNIYPSINICSKKIYRNIDRKMIERVLDNVLSNVIKYAYDKVSITLLDNGKIIIQNNTQKLDKVSVAKIFDRYYTIENGNNNSGLGLSIAKELVELNGGKIMARYKNKELIIEIEV